VLVLLAISAANLNPANYAALNAYVESGVSKTMPAGTVYYTVHV
jgi:hypothetical protein